MDEMEMQSRVSVSVLARYLKKVITLQDLLPPIGRRINCQREFWIMEVFVRGRFVDSERLWGPGLSGYTDAAGDF